MLLVRHVKRIGKAPVAFKLSAVDVTVFQVAALKPVRQLLYPPPAAATP